MKKFIYFATVSLLALSLVSCERFLDTTNYWSKDSSNFPVNTTDADQMITGIYNNLNITIADEVHKNHFIWNNICSDDCLGAGGNDDVDAQAEDLLMNNGADMYNTFYVERYQGIARANAAIETLASCGVTGDKLMQYYGEAFFLRAWFYYELATMFGNIPVPIASTADPTLPQLSGEALWGRIMEDCKIAADIMPAVKSTGDGHVDKYCAEALLGRAYLFASGFYGIETFTLPAYENEGAGVKIEEGTKLGKSDVGAYIKDCVKSGYELVDDPHNLWPYTNRCSVEDESSPWKGKGYHWCQDDGAVNPEALFVIKFNTQADWGTTMGYSNFTALYMGVRGQESNEDHFPFGTGWGMCSVSPQFVADWEKAEPADKRRDASIINVDNGLWNYKFNGENNTQETGFYQTKIMAVTAYDDEGELRTSFFNVMYPGMAYASGDPEDKDYNMLADMAIIRYAEVLLMDAEINNNQESFDKVRARAGLPSKPITEENIRNERRWELCFEGIRFDDIRRYGVEYAAAALDKQDGVPCYNCSDVIGTNTASKFNGGYGKRYRETKGFVKIPSSQISLSAGAGAEYTFTQNEGWGAGTDFSGWN